MEYWIEEVQPVLWIVMNALNLWKSLHYFKTGQVKRYCWEIYGCKKLYIIEFDSHVGNFVVRHYENRYCRSVCFIYVYCATKFGFWRLKDHFSTVGRALWAFERALAQWGAKPLFYFSQWGVSMRIHPLWLSWSIWGEQMLVHGTWWPYSNLFRPVTSLGQERFSWLM